LLWENSPLEIKAAISGTFREYRLRRVTAAFAPIADSGEPHQVSRGFALQTEARER